MAKEKKKHKWAKHHNMEKFSSIEDSDKDHHRMIAAENMQKAAHHNAHTVHKASAAPSVIRKSMYGGK